MSLLLWYVIIILSPHQAEKVRVEEQMSTQLQQKDAELQSTQEQLHQREWELRQTRVQLQQKDDELNSIQLINLKVQIDLCTPEAHVHMM